MIFMGIMTEEGEVSPDRIQILKVGLKGKGILYFSSSPFYRLKLKRVKSSICSDSIVPNFLLRRVIEALPSEGWLGKQSECCCIAHACCLYLTIYYCKIGMSYKMAIAWIRKIQDPRHNYIFFSNPSEAFFMIIIINNHTCGCLKFNVKGGTPHVFMPCPSPSTSGSYQELDRKCSF
jgi:hypothetical protein